MKDNSNRTLSTDKIARVEGSGNIEVIISNNQVEEVKLNIFEGPRLVEEIVKGKSIDEVISIVPRICAICNLSHKLASLTAMRQATNTIPSEHALWFGKLMHMGEMIESHTLHLYLLVLPDLFKVPSAIELLDNHAPTVTEGLKQKKFANSIMYLAGGNRMIHGENPKVGGYGSYPSIDTLSALTKESKLRLLDSIKIVELFGKLELPDYNFSETTYMCVDPPEEKFGFTSEHIRTSTGIRYSVVDYHEAFVERVVPHSFAKRALHFDKPYTVGAQARMVILGDRLEGKAGELYSKYFSKEWLTNPMYNNFAQAIENVYAMEQVPYYIKKLKNLLNEDPLPEAAPLGTLSGRGVGAVEAPRGLLIHDYTIKNGNLMKCNIITPTAQNLDDIESHLRQAANHLLTDKISDEDLEFNLEMLTRSYDPCISCSAHMVSVKHR
jgi:sulfhydrogenase subunit alpha